MATRPGDSTTPWRIKGDWWDLCNCGIGCPCLFGENPTLGYCEGMCSPTSLGKVITETWISVV